MPPPTASKKAKPKPRPWIRDIYEAARQGKSTKVAQLLEELEQEDDEGKLRAALRQALQGASAKGDDKLVEFLLSKGASTEASGKEGPALIRAIEADSPEIDAHKVVKLLVQHQPKGASVYGLAKRSPTLANDPHQRALFLAVEKRSHKIVQELLSAGVDVNAKDTEGRTVLIYLAYQENRVQRKAGAAETDFLHYQKIIKLLFTSSIDIEAKFEGRTALHWAVSRGNAELVRVLLAYGEGRSADIHALALRKKTALHLAAEKNFMEVIEILLKHGADHKATSDGAWTPLHNAADQGHSRVVRLLLDSNADATAATDAGRLPLHWAAEKGHVDCVRLLIPKCGFKRHAKDSEGLSPRMLAAKNRHIAILQLFNYEKDLSSMAKEVCQAYNAMIVNINPQKRDLPRYMNVKRPSMYDLLYATEGDERDSVIKLWNKSDASLKGSNFQWVHLPANNMAWVEALITKYYIERGAEEIDAFKDAANSLNHQHSGQTFHSTYMKPSCQRVTPVSEKDFAEFGLLPIRTSSTLRKRPVDKFEESEPSKVTVSSDIVQNEVQHEVRKNLQRPVLQYGSMDEAAGTRLMRNPLRFDIANAVTDEPLSDFARRAKKKVKPRKDSTHSADSNHHIPKRARRGSRNSNASVNAQKRPVDNEKPSKFGEIFLFMPILHFELFDNWQKMSTVLNEIHARSSSRRALAKSRLNQNDASFLDNLVSSVPLNMRAGMEQEYYARLSTENISGSTAPTREGTPGLMGEGQEMTRDEKLICSYLLEASPLHPRRTLDQFYYPAGNTADRDQDQVVYRYFKTHRIKEPKMFMVDQLWMWMLGKDLIITCCPQRWEEDRKDSFNLANKVMLDLKETRPSSVYELASCITDRCSGMFYTDTQPEEYRFLDMFEDSIGDLQDKEPELSLKFKNASRSAEEWFANESKTKKNPNFDDYFTRVGSEMAVLAEAKDIRNELEMLSAVLETQATLIPQLKDAVKGEFDILKAKDAKAELNTSFDAQTNDINAILEHLERMDKQVGDLYDECDQLLDLKQKYAGVFEARYSRMQATSSVRQGHTIMVFTVVTVAFLPMSFIAAFFAIPADDFKDSLPLGYVSKYIFAIGLSISVPLVILALTVDNISRLYNRTMTNLNLASPSDPSSSSNGVLFATSSTIPNPNKSSVIPTATDALSIFANPKQPRVNSGHRHRQGDNPSALDKAFGFLHQRRHNVSKERGEDEKRQDGLPKRSMSWLNERQRELRGRLGIKGKGGRGDLEGGSGW